MIIKLCLLVQIISGGSRREPVTVKRAGFESAIDIYEQPKRNQFNTDKQYELSQTNKQIVFITISNLVKSSGGEERAAILERVLVHTCQHTIGRDENTEAEQNCEKLSFLQQVLRTFAVFTPAMTPLGFLRKYGEEPSSQ